EKDVAPVEADGVAGMARMWENEGIGDDPVRMDQVVRATAEGASESAAGAEEIERCREGGAGAGALVGGEGAAVAEELQGFRGVAAGDGFEVGALRPGR